MNLSIMSYLAAQNLPKSNTFRGIENLLLLKLSRVRKLEESSIKSLAFDMPMESQSLHNIGTLLSMNFAEGIKIGNVP